MITSSGIEVHDHRDHHGLCWSGVIAGAFATAALALILLTLGVGLGLSSISPWVNRVSPKTIAEGAIAWLVLSQILAGGMGGYLAGRLRHRWTGVHLDEVHFRDSAQGFLAWSVAILLTAAFLTSASTSMIGEGHRMGPPPMGHAAMSAPAPAAPVASTGTGMSPTSQEDVAKVDETTRKDAAYTALWFFIALLAGAFSAAVAGTVGGRHRDHLYPNPV